MGRRKIEIKAIKDDRNRSVTFLKRKGGLFKKAHELSVLCSVDVAVIIFGQNKKLYEYSSGDIRQTLTRYQYYDGPHEHKGPADFADKDGGDDDDDDDAQAGSPGPEENSPPHHGVPSFHPQPGFSNVRHPTASPPMRNGMFPGHRMSTPQPQGLSRPPSRTHRRASSNLVPPNQPHPQAVQPQTMPINYQQYQQNQQYYQHVQQQQQQQQHHPHPHPHPHMQMHHPQGSPPIPQHSFSHPVPPHSQMQHMYLQDQRRQSMPPNFPQHPQDRPQSVPTIHQSPPQLSRPFQSPPLPGSPKQHPPHTSRSVTGFSHIEDVKPNMAQHQWAAQEVQARPRSDSIPNKSDNTGRSQSIDSGNFRDRPNGYSPKPQFAAPPSLPLQRAKSPLSNAGSSAPNTATFPPPQPPSRVNSLASDSKRPRLTVQIPSEQSDAENNGSGDATAETTASPRELNDNPEANNISGKQNNNTSGPGTSAGTGTNGSSAQSHPTSVVLPPPSPSATNSASALLSAGATGPKNPFARPPPRDVAGPLNTNVAYKDSMETATPISALPSRFMGDSFLPSPSQFYPDWGFGSVGSGSGNITSPATYQPTPVKETGSGWKESDAGDDGSSDGKRKRSEEREGEIKKARY